MDERSVATLSRMAGLPTVKYVFGLLLAVLLVLAVGHLYAFSGLTTLYLGLPLWVWLQLGTVTVMLVVAWIAVQLMAGVTGRGM